MSTTASSTIDLARRIWNAAYLTGTFTLRAGGTTNEYFDKYRFESDPALLREICERLAGLLDDVDAEAPLAGLDLGGVPLATVLSQVTGRPTRFVRKAPKEYGTRLQVEGGDIAGQRVVVVEDVATTGRSIADGIAAVRAAGAEVQLALCVVDRQDGAVETLAAVGVELRALFTSAELRAAAGA